MPRIISNFHGCHEFLSNFAPCKLHYGNLNYNTTEAAFQAAKTTSFEQQFAISIADTPGQAKRLGRRVTLRPDWEDIKVNVMTDLLRLKFTKGSEYARMLDDTGQAILVEGTTWHDQTWGVCKCDEHKGIGKNLLGQILMQIRSENRGMTPSDLHMETRDDWLFGGPFTISERQ